MKRIQRNRYLTPAEAEKYNTIREQVRNDLPGLKDKVMIKIGDRIYIGTRIGTEYNQNATLIRQFPREDAYHLKLDRKVGNLTTLVVTAYELEELRKENAVRSLYEISRLYHGIDRNDLQKAETQLLDILKREGVGDWEDVTEDDGTVLYQEWATNKPPIDPR